MNPPGWEAGSATTTATYGGAVASGGGARRRWMGGASSGWASSDGTISSAHMARSRHSPLNPKGPAPCVSARSQAAIESSVFVEYPTVMVAFRYRVACEQQRSPQRSRSTRSVDSGRTRRKGCSGRSHEVRHHADCDREGAGYFRATRESTACSSHSGAISDRDRVFDRRQRPRSSIPESREPDPSRFHVPLRGSPTPVADVLH